MPLHLIKLCVGVDKVDQLTAWGREERGKGRTPIVHTRQTPKRAADILEGGSLFWVIKGVVLCRQVIVDVRTVEEGPRSRCEIELAEPVILTAPMPRRAFQGWRYLEAKDIPADLFDGGGTDLPADLARELRTLGAW